MFTPSCLTLASVHREQSSCCPLPFWTPFPGGPKLVANAQETSGCHPPHSRGFPGLAGVGGVGHAVPPHRCLPLQDD